MGLCPIFTILKSMHFSLDVWNTLLKPNPIFARKRNSFYADFFDEDIEVVEYKHKKLKEFFEYTHRTLGISFDIDKVYEILCNYFGEYEKANIFYVRTFTENLFTSNLPFILESTVNHINWLRENGSTFSIISNTSNISGNIIESVLTLYGLEFEDYKFSDIEGVAKPNPEIFRRSITDLEKKGVNIKDFIHIGDDDICDVPPNHLNRRLISGVDMLPNILKQYRYEKI